MTIKQYLNSDQFKKEYVRWNYANSIFDENGDNLIDHEELKFKDYETYDEFLNTHEVISVRKAWFIGANDRKQHAYAKIITSL